MRKLSVYYMKSEIYEGGGWWG